MASWFAYCGLRWTETFTVVRCTKLQLAGIVVLDATRAAALALLIVLGSLLSSDAETAVGGIRSLVFWPVLGLSSFFVDLRVPQGFPKPTESQRRRRTSGRTGRDSDSNEMLRSPTVGIWSGLRERFIHTLQLQVAGVLSSRLVLARARAAKEFVEAFKTGVRLEDVHRFIAEIRAYVQSARGSLNVTMTKELLHYLDMLEIDMGNGAHPPSEQEFLATVKAILARLEKDGLDDLRDQLLTTTRRLD